MKDNIDSNTLEIDDKEVYRTYSLPQNIVQKKRLVKRMKSTILSRNLQSVDEIEKP